MTPRTGCTAIAALLKTEYKGLDLPSTDLLDDAGNMLVQSKHNTLKQLLEHRLIDQGEADSVYKFASVRNPFDSLASLYQKQREQYQPLINDPDSWVHRIPGYIQSMRFCRDHSFDEWIEKYYGRRSLLRRKLRPRSMFRHFTRNMDFVIRFENMQADFKTVLREAGVDRAMEIPELNRTSNKRHYREYYSPKSRRIVEREFREDLKRYGYGY